MKELLQKIKENIDRKNYEDIEQLVNSLEIIFYKTIINNAIEEMKKILEQLCNSDLIIKEKYKYINTEVSFNIGRVKEIQTTLGVFLSRFNIINDKEHKYNNMVKIINEKEKINENDLEKITGIQKTEIFKIISENYRKDIKNIKTITENNKIYYIKNKEDVQHTIEDNKEVKRLSKLNKSVGNNGFSINI